MAHFVIQRSIIKNPRKIVANFPGLLLTIAQPDPRGIHVTGEFGLPKNISIFLFPGIIAMVRSLATPGYPERFSLLGLLLL